MRWVLASIVFALPGCSSGAERSDAPPAAEAAQKTAPVAVAPHPSTTAQASAASPAPSSKPSASAPAASAAPAVEVAACGDSAVQLAFTGPALLRAAAGDVRVLFNDAGVARPVVPAAAPARGRAALDAKPPKSTSPACAHAADRYLCADANGELHRQKEAGEGDKVIAKARPGAPLAAATIGGHGIVAFLGDRKTTEGAVTLAFVGLDDATPVLLSEEGSGATFVALAPAGDRILAAYVDARRAMTPVHARELRLGNAGALELGKDAVAFVGEGSDARTPCSLIAAGASAIALVPVGDGSSFGMAAVRLGLPPVDDAPTTWSLYPNGCAPAPIAATGEFPAKVARARPIGREPGSKKTLELGDLDAAGVFTPVCSLAEASSFTDVAVARDAHATTWIAFTDGDGTWLVRRPDAPPTPSKR